MAFDHVEHNKLMAKIWQSQMDGKDQILIQNLYQDQTSLVRLDSEAPESFPITGGRQECVLLPKLFDLCSTYC